MDSNKNKLIDESPESNTTTDSDRIDDLGFSVPLNKPTKSKQKGSNIMKSFIDCFHQYQGNIETVNFKSKLVKFNALLSNKKARYKILIVILIAFCMGLATTLLVKNSGLYSLGINGIWQGIARITKTSMLMDGTNSHTAEAVYDAIFWTMVVLSNIPLVIFAYKKISKQFAYLTIMYVFCSQMFGYFLGFAPIEIHIFGNPNTVPNLSSIVTNPDLQENLKNSIVFSCWGQSGNISLLMYGFVYGLISGISYSLVLMVGGSTGGADVIGCYFAKQKTKPIGTLLLILNNICLFTSTIIGTLGSLLVIDDSLVTHSLYYFANDSWSAEAGTSSVFQAIFSPNWVFSALTAIIGGVTVDFFYPKSKFVQIKVYTNDAESFKASLQLIGYKHDIYVNKIKDGLEDSSFYTIETICMYIELSSVLNAIRAVDKQSLITINKLQDIDGDMNVIK